MLFRLFFLLQLDLFHLSEQVGGEDEVVERFVVGGDDLLFRALPLLNALFDEDDVVADVDHRVHVVGVDYGRHLILHGDVVDQVVDQKRRLRVEARVGLVAEEVLGVERDGAGYGGSLHHAAADLGGVEVARLRQVDSLEAELGA